MADHDNRTTHTRTTALWVAIIGAAGTVVAAVIAMGHGPATSAITVTGASAPIAISGGVAVGRDLHGDVYTAPVYKTYRNSNPFKEQNGLMFSGSHVTAFYRPGDPARQFITLAVLNTSSRRIERAQIFIFDTSKPRSDTPYAASEERAVGQRDTLLNDATNTLPISSSPPENLMVCLTYESDRPGVFITVLLSMKRGPTKKSTPYAYPYTASNDYQIFYSGKHADCERLNALENIPAAEYFGRG